ncbi:hypothetical protein BH20VER1_BH20VER1_02190 [soil metagenome]
MNLDDPKLTAFALDELPETERAAMARAVAASPDAQAFVQETHELAGLLRGEFRQDLRRAAAKPLNILPLPEERSFWPDSRWGSIGVAALLAMAAVVGAVVISETQRGEAVVRQRVAEESTLQMEVVFPPPDEAAVASQRKAIVALSPLQGGDVSIVQEGAEIDSLSGNYESSPLPVPAGTPAQTKFLSGANTGSPAFAGRIQPRAPELQQEPQTAEYGRFDENPFLAAAAHPLSTFSTDVDTASYANVRRFILSGTRPPKDVVRIEEMINYFSYDYPQPEGEAPFSIALDAATCPWTPEHHLVRIGLKGREIAAAQRGATNLVFLLDVSGSMMPANRLPLVKQAMRLLVEQLTAEDRVAIVVYAGASGLVLPPTRGDRKEEIVRALEALEAGGSTNGGAGIELAYRIATENFVAGGVNRVILATDGDFNVGVTSSGELVRLAEEKAKSGVFLTVLGVGDNNFKDATMEQLSGKANGNYAYLDSLTEARKVLVEQANGTLVTIAKDVKVQVEFNPARVASYRLIGYENRLLRKEDFNDDKVDAGEIGAGHTVTALYEVVPVGAAADPAASVPPVDALKYSAADRAVANGSGDLLTVKLRHKKPDGDVSELTERSLGEEPVQFSAAPADFRFAAAVAEFGMILRGSPHKGNASIATALERAEEAKGPDEAGYRAGFLELVRQAQGLAF